MWVLGRIALTSGRNIYFGDACKDNGKAVLSLVSYLQSTPLHRNGVDSMRFDMMVAFSNFTGYTGKPKGADGYEAIRPAGQDEQAL